MDHLFTLNELTPKIKYSRETSIDPQVIFGIGSLFSTDTVFHLTDKDSRHNDEVEIMSISSGHPSNMALSCDHDNCNFCGSNLNTNTLLDHDKLKEALSLLSKEYVWRVKGFIQLQPLSSYYILNWAFGRYELYSTNKILSSSIQLTIIGKRDDLKEAIQTFIRLLQMYIHTSNVLTN